MKTISILQSTVPFKDDQVYQQNKTDENGQVVNDKNGQPVKEDIIVRSLLIRAIYEFFPPAPMLKVLKQISKIASKLEESEDAVELSDEQFEILVAAVEQLVQAIPQAGRGPLFRPVMIGRVLEMMDVPTKEEA